MEKTQLVEIGQRLRKRRTELGLTREKMAELAVPDTTGNWKWALPKCPLIPSSSFPVPCIFPWITSSLGQKMLPAMLPQF